MRVLLLLLLAATLPAQMSLRAPIDVIPFNGDLVEIFADNTVRFTSIEAILRGEDPPVTVATEQLPELKTSWVDKTNVTHTVTTPVVGNTGAAFKRALDAHRARVTAMQAVWPPKKV